MKEWQSWRTLRDSLGHVGIVRATEITFSDLNGWHPHLHLWFITNRAITAKERAEAEAKISKIWKKAVSKHSGIEALVPDDVHGCDLRIVDSRGIAAYIQKLQDVDEEIGQRRKLSSELVRSDLKTGKARNSTVPFELLDNPKYRDQWVEYANTTKGRHAIGWTPGLRKRLGIEKKSKPKAKNSVVGSCQNLSDPRVFTIDRADYAQNRKNPEWLAEVLTATELNPDVAADQFGVVLSPRC